MAQPLPPGNPFLNLIQEISAPDQDIQRVLRILGGADSEMARLEQNISPLSSVFLRVISSTSHLENDLQQYASDMIQLWAEMREHLDEERNQVDAPLLRAIQRVFDENNNLIRSLDDLVAQIPEHCQRNRELIHRINPPTFEAFLDKYKPLVVSLRGKGFKTDIQCSVCAENMVTVCIYRLCQRACGSDNEPACECRPQICLDCLLNVFWTQSEHELRSTAPCPICRSPFCLMDIVPLPEPAPPKETPKKRAYAKKTSSSKRVRK